MPVEDPRDISIEEHNHTRTAKRVDITNAHDIDMALGNITGHAVKTIYGRNPDIDIASGFETIWNGGGVYSGQNATGAELVEVYSDSAADTSNGTGARTITITGLSAAGVEQSETITLNGVTAVDSTKSYLRMEKGSIITAGSGGVNAGQITCRQKTSTSNVFFVMPAGFNHTAVGAYTVPAGKQGLLRCYGVEVLSTLQTTEARLWIRQPSTAWQVEDVTNATNSKAGGRTWVTYKDEILAPLTDIRVDGNSDKNNGVIGCEICLVLIDV